MRQSISPPPHPHPSSSRVFNIFKWLHLGQGNSLFVVVVVVANDTSHEIYHFDSVHVCSSVALSPLAVPCDSHHDPLPGLFLHRLQKSVPIKQQLSIPHSL